ncbi:sodium/glutamate symporter [Conchiformibius steedae DSM 2580]|uniref:Sodium/glutamate symporter n=2 Tax=Conchiformibius steedae TaxID=153493 RepID=A0A3P2A4Q3_9NEIS|nr:sodium/glutamate symporter [Conchiformibius steedae]QMT33052.1 sodium/glutamate symporter [Conchiformibius steedae]RRD90384.1 sodium/glutamate symporter [Conchiformibius steedae]URD67680.1 sodium/glutamate symporter [Conchiformibius steedae DSM 2580]
MNPTTVEPIVLNGYYTLIAATLVLLLGKFLVSRIKFLRDFNIPEPVAGGLLTALLVTVLHAAFGLEFQIEKSLQDAFMLIFFASIGLSADFSRLKQGGLPLLVFLALVSGFIVVQNAVGVGMASALGLDPLVGLITGSITLVGGHGTGATYGDILTKQYGIVGASEMAIVSATFGLVAGGLIGGPVARRLVNNMGRKPVQETTAKSTSADAPGRYDDQTFESARHQRLITAESAVETMALFAACLAFSAVMKGMFAEHEVLKKLPQFVWALGFGVVLRNLLTTVFKFDMFDRAIDVFGNASLSLFLAMALMSMKLWQLSGMVGAMSAILAVQTVVMILFAYFVTFRVMGKNYDAAVLAAGHCGFGMGATPTAVANMQSITNTFGASHKAFLIVPLVGAFFIDFVNFALIGVFMEMFGK